MEQEESIILYKRERSKLLLPQVTYKKRSAFVHTGTSRTSELLLDLDAREQPLAQEALQDLPRRAQVTAGTAPAGNAQGETPNAFHFGRQVIPYTKICTYQSLS